MRASKLSFLFTYILFFKINFSISFDITIDHGITITTREINSSSPVILKKYNSLRIYLAI